MATPESDKPRRSRASDLLARVIAEGRLDSNLLAGQLAVSQAVFDAYLTGTVLMPPAQQLRLALIVIERDPELARPAHNLRAQAEAAITFQEGETTTHTSAPHPGPRSY